jgi:hypothetical protein
MEVADRVARRYEGEPRLHRLCPVIVPVNGLLGHTAATLRETEFALLSKLAQAPIEELAELLLTADRFSSAPSRVPVTELERAHLLERLGLYGVRLSVELIRGGVTPTSAELSTELAERSGLNRLRAILGRQFEVRARVLKAYSAMAALTDLLRSGELANAVELQFQLEELTAGAHEFQEIRVLSDLRSGGIPLKPERQEQLDRLLGGSGHDPASRLGLPPEAGAEEVRQAAVAALAGWQAFAEHPLTTRAGQLAARTATRTLEGLLG